MLCCGVLVLAVVGWAGAAGAAGAAGDTRGLVDDPVGWTADVLETSWLTLQTLAERWLASAAFLWTSAEPEDTTMRLGLICMCCSVLLYIAIVMLVRTVDERDDLIGKEFPENRGFTLIAKHPSYPAPCGQLVPQCPCFEQDNYYLDSVSDKLGGKQVPVRAHVSYNGDNSQFCMENERLIRTWTAEQLDDALQQLRDERVRRETAAERVEAHRQLIAREYKFITTCRVLKMSHLAPEIQSIMNFVESSWTMEGRLPPTTNEDALVGKSRLIRLGEGIFAVPFFTAACVCLPICGWIGV